MKRSSIGIRQAQPSSRRNCDPDGKAESRSNQAATVGGVRETNRATSPPRSSARISRGLGPPLDGKAPGPHRYSARKAACHWPNLEMDGSIAARDTPNAPGLRRFKAPEANNP